MAKRTDQPEAPPVKIERFSQTLKVQLTQAQVADRADRAASVLLERDRKEDEMKAAQKHAKSVIETLEASLRELSNEVRNRSTYSNVECERRYLYAEGKYEEVRTDTGEVLLSRELKEHERQRELPFEGNGDA